MKVTTPATIATLQRAADGYAETAAKQRDRQAQLMKDRDDLTAELERVSAELADNAKWAADNEAQAADMRRIIATLEPPAAEPGPARTAPDNGGQPRTRSDGRLVATVGTVHRPTQETPAATTENGAES